jgi:hypothetical protein
MNSGLWIWINDFVDPYPNWESEYQIRKWENEEKYVHFG